MAQISRTQIENWNQSKNVSAQAKPGKPREGYRAWRSAPGIAETIDMIQTFAHLLRELGVAAGQRGVKIKIKLN